MKTAVYLTDDRDLPKEDLKSLVIFQGGNGDWYVQVGDANGFASEGVRLCTSGGASYKVPGLTNAIGEAFRCIIAAQEGVSRTSLINESYTSLKAEVEAWRARYPEIKFQDEVSGFVEVI